MNGGMDGMDLNEAQASGTAFCTGDMGMVMFMDGFRWALKGGSSCLNLYFPGWTLDSEGKFAAAMAGVFVLAMLTEAISKLRHNLNRKSRSVSTSLTERKKLKLAQTALHGLHAFVGYIVMLATMTFALELLVCVVVGLTFGYLLFGGESYSHVSTNPCCAFLEDEANERSIGSDPVTDQQIHVDDQCCGNNDDVENSATIANGSDGSIHDNQIASS